jgi:hypothetical protein
VYFSTENLKATRGWNDVFQALKENHCQSGLLNPGNLSLIIQGKIKKK